MLTRWLLIATPVVLMLILFQSVLWVPGYDSLNEQTGDDAQPSSAVDARRLSFVEASIGDASILNPILNADTASSRIVDLVFDGLLTLDQDLKIQPKMATKYDVSEWVYLAISDDNIEQYVSRLRTAMEADPDLGQRLRQLSVTDAAKRQITLEQEQGDPIPIHVDIAPRVKVELDRVMPDLQQRLDTLGLWNPAPASDYLSWSMADQDDQKAGAVTESLQAQAQTLVQDAVPVIEHNPVIDFSLRTDVRFHDGHAFDADDVRFTYEAIMNPANLSPRTADFEPIKEVQVVDKANVRIVYKRLFSPAVLAWTMPILPEHLLNDEQMAQARAQAGKDDDDAFAMRDVAFNRNPIGTGPYRFVSWQSDDSIQLAANTDYYEASPELTKYAFRILPDSLVQELELSAGAIDVFQPQPYQVERFVEDERFHTVSMPGNGYSYIAYNLRRPVFADVKVRKALSMAINIDEILRYVLFGEGEQTSGPYPMNTPWYDASIAPVAYDPEAAVALLNEAGWEKNSDGWMEKDGKELSFTLITNQGNATREAILSIAQDAWRRIGVRCETQIFEWAVFLQDFVNKGEYDALILGWSMGADPDLYQLWHSSQTDYAELNFTGYKNDRVDQLIEEIRQQYNYDQQVKLTHELHSIIAQDQPYTFLFAPTSTRVLNKSLKIRSQDGGLESIEPVPSGAIYQHFDRWTRASMSPDS